MSMFNNIGSEQATFTTGTSLQDMMQNLNSKSSATTSAVAGDTVSISSEAASIVAQAKEDSGEKSMMANNFVSATKGESSYITATKNALATSLSMRNTKADAVSSGMEDLMSGLQDDIETQASAAVKSGADTMTATAKSTLETVASATTKNTTTTASGVAASGGGAADTVEVNTASEKRENAPSSSGSVDVVV
ncbi:MAG: hypothetical protein AB7E47_17610 [Desulfovibrionaceae bacterium]